MDGIIKYQLDLIFLSTIVTFLFAIGSIIYSVKYKKYDEVKGAKLLQISIIVAVIIFVLNLLTLFGLR
ncbi:hypothetical protein ACUXKH_001728 [Staphylococcus epidermidis]|uniref:hypothetical protein n=1 Tax=Staphylococcus epidermidis TaxID=1282 RepID=UPI00138E4486|nr:hypothetical protein [Staphylococcus epidermidis]MCG2282987.1 hypothetical protein [Staphylococcus epidermidis]MCO6291787.1 hypothetical protein [Staphylococcus epidermidis]MDS3947089.1 hypothetical protein [Staphylococcus epidermidis]